MQALQRPTRAMLPAGASGRIQCADYSFLRSSIQLRWIQCRLGVAFTRSAPVAFECRIAPTSPRNDDLHSLHLVPVGALLQAVRRPATVGARWASVFCSG